VPSTSLDPPSRVIVAIDGSRPALGALSGAAGLARRVGASLVLLHVAMFVRTAARDAPRAWVRAEEEARRDGERSPHEAYLLAEDVVVARELHFGKPAPVICRRARELGADFVVVVGNRRLGRIDRLLLGSVSAAVAAQAPCSVLVVRAQAEDTPAPPRTVDTD
jgi:nucleotide-binding universal stress UspA family protein